MSDEDDKLMYKVKLSSRRSYDEVKSLIDDMVSNRMNFLSSKYGFDEDKDQQTLDRFSVDGKKDDRKKGLSSEPFGKVIEEPTDRKSNILSIVTNMPFEIKDLVDGITGVRGIRGSAIKVGDEKGCIDLDEFEEMVEGKTVTFDSVLGKYEGVVEGIDFNKEKVNIRSERDSGRSVRMEMDLEEIFPEEYGSLCLDDEG